MYIVVKTGTLDYWNVNTVLLVSNLPGKLYLASKLASSLRFFLYMSEQERRIMKHTIK